MGLRDLFGGSSKRAMDVLVQLQTDKTTLAMEIEGTPQRFRSRLLLKDDQVVLAKPTGTELTLSVGSIVRFRIPEDPDHDLRLEVFAPHVNLASGNAVFLCRIPSGGPATARRHTLRHGLAHLSNVLLVMPSRTREFRLTDISYRGCRIVVSASEAQSYFPVGRELSNMHVQIGAKAQVELAAITPRAHGKNFVGCEFNVKDEGTSQVYLGRLIEKLADS